MKEIEKNKRISKYINMFQPPSSPTYKLDKTEEAGKRFIDVKSLDCQYRKNPSMF